MITTIRSFFIEKMFLPEQQESQKKYALEMAVAALLIEVSRADLDLSSSEKMSVITTLKQTFSLSGPDLVELIALAEQEVESSISIFQFTQLVNQEYSQPEKLELIEAMWRVAFADGELDKYEDYLIRKVADLIYVSHSDFIQRKLKVAESLDSNQER